jgi:GNAT superfamily N-acetyltransferase
MKIEELNPSEIEELSQFKSANYPTIDKDHYGESLPDFTQMEVTLIARHNGNIVGYLDMSICLGVGSLKSLMVGVEYQGKGFGKELVMKAEQKARSLNTHKITVETGLNWKAKPFYEKLGYAVRAVLPNDFNGEDAVLLDKML